MSDRLKVEARGPVLRVSLNRPELRNAFDDHLIALMHLQVGPRLYGARRHAEYGDVPFGDELLNLRA